MHYDLNSYLRVYIYLFYKLPALTNAQKNNVKYEETRVLR